jgi:hypothetical protein
MAHYFLYFIPLFLYGLFLSLFVSILITPKITTKIHTISSTDGEFSLLVAGGDGISDGCVGANVKAGGCHSGDDLSDLCGLADGDVIAAALKRGWVVIHVQNNYFQNSRGGQLWSNLEKKRRKNW